MFQFMSILAWVSGLAFSAYGVLCVFSGHMKAEFERYGLTRFRRMVGVLEILGGLGVLLGQYWSPLMMFSAAGLVLLMAAGLWARTRVGDSFVQMAPAAILLLVNAYLFWGWSVL